MVIAAIFLISLVEIAFGKILIKKEDPCDAHCENTYISLGEIDYIKSCCYKGCRFFKLVEQNVLNTKKNACVSSCEEAYVDLYERFACYKGCNFWKNNYVADAQSMDLNLLLKLPDLPETDILSDPGLKKELLPGWWYFTGFKLPQTFFKSVPSNSKIIDYGYFPDYSSDVEKLSNTNHDWTWRAKTLIILLILILFIISLLVLIYIERKYIS